MSQTTSRNSLPPTAIDQRNRALLPAYKQNPALLQHHLPHRQPAELESVPQRMGWLTWEDSNRLQPGTCPWLPAQQT